MAISSDYPRPVNVNGYQCHNCAEVSQAKKFIDPAHAKSGPFGADADKDPNASAAAKARAAEKTGDAVHFGGALSYRNTGQPINTAQSPVGVQPSTDVQPAPPANADGTGFIFDKVA